VCSLGPPRLGLAVLAERVCRLTNVYENYRWRLCESLFDAVAPSAAFISR
jgi:hypothetical protein